MAGDGSDNDVKIPAVLLFSEEGRILKNAIAAMEDLNQRLTVRLASKATGKPGMTLLIFFSSFHLFRSFYKSDHRWSTAAYKYLLPSSV